ncbi:MAG: PfkB family carbohydrate kinase [Anaerolineae bacterium]|nr:PfkB family carbohydrate kinase [Anaerolineae bacterium]
MQSSLPNEIISKERLSRILMQCHDLHIGVIGDLALDAYWYADMTRACLSRETPHFPRPVVREAYGCGAGANVAHNLKALGVGHVSVFSVLGDDWRGKLLHRMMLDMGLDGEQLLFSPQRLTTAYIKPQLMGYESQQEDARIDFENTQPLTRETEDALLGAACKCLPGMDAVIVADQLEVNGIITDRVRQGLNELASQNQDKVFVVDSRLRIGAYKSMVLKPNQQEALAAVGSSLLANNATLGDLAGTALHLNQHAQRPVFLTLGSQGVLTATEGDVRHIAAGPTHPPLDPVGAGDSFISAVTAALAVGAHIWEAGALANLAAAVTVEKLHQTGTASSAEIIAKCESDAEGKVDD